LNFAAVVAAAGIGSRLPLPDDIKAKQFLSLGGIPIYLWSLSRFALHKEIEKIALVVSPDFKEIVRRDFADAKVAKIAEKVVIVDGGDTRQESVKRALEALESDHPQYVLVHDAARPFLTDEMIDASIRGVTEYGACTLAVPVSDTVKKAVNKIFVKTVDRADLYQIQTPQSARFEWLLDAHRQGATTQLSTTDDGGILEAAGYKVYLIPGSAHNLKLTKPDDLALCNALATIYSPALNHL
jgi:2-C-methyl-D-erythritol 4-phosphate cytidylyltransferase